MYIITWHYIHSTPTDAIQSLSVSGSSSSSVRRQIKCWIYLQKRPLLPSSYVTVARNSKHDHPEQYCSNLLLVLRQAKIHLEWIINRSDYLLYNQMVKQKKIDFFTDNNVKWWLLLHENLSFGQSCIISEKKRFEMLKRSSEQAHMLSK